MASNPKKIEQLIDDELQIVELTREVSCSMYEQQLMVESTQRVVCEKCSRHCSGRKSILPTLCAGCGGKLYAEV